MPTYFKGKDLSQLTEAEKQGLFDEEMRRLKGQPGIRPISTANLNFNSRPVSSPSLGALDQAAFDSANYGLSSESLGVKPISSGNMSGSNTSSPGSSSSLLAPTSESAAGMESAAAQIGAAGSAAGFVPVIGQFIQLGTSIVSKVMTYMAAKKREQAQIDLNNEIRIAAKVAEAKQKNANLANAEFVNKQYADQRKDVEYARSSAEESKNYNKFLNFVDGLRSHFNGNSAARERAIALSKSLQRRQ